MAAVVYGVTPTGFVRKTLAAILADLSTAQRATIAATLDVSSDSVMGQINGIFARELGICWEQVEIVYHANDPDAAEDILLTMLCKLTGTIRRAATPSVVVLKCNLTAGTALLAGTHFASNTGRPDIRWTPAADVPIPGSTGDVNVDFVSEQLGPIVGLAGDIAVIATPVVGWNSVTNVADAEPGRLIDSDPILQQRREDELAAVGSTTVRAIRSKILEFLPDVSNVTVFENDSDYVDGVTGNAPHSLEVLIFDGVSPLVANNDIAQIIWDNKAAGVQTLGSSSGTAVIDDLGSTRTVFFSRVAIVDVYLVYVITTGPGYIGDSALKGLIAENANAKFGPNQAVKAVVVEAMALPPNPGVSGVTDITTFTLGTAPSPSGTISIPIGLRQIARFDTSRISITP